jgi:hypothetical protein
MDKMDDYIKTHMILSLHWVLTYYFIDKKNIYCDKKLAYAVKLKNLVDLLFGSYKL